MSKLYRAQREFQEMDALATQESPIHRLYPPFKLIITLFYIFTVVSFGKYDLTGLIVMILYPVILFEVSGIPVRTCFHKLRIVLPLVCAVGLFNPFFDRTAAFMIGGFTVTGGMISMLTLMLKGIFTLMASFLLIATTPIDVLCASLRRLHVPQLFVTLMLLTYRYISLMIGELAIMSDAYALRAPGHKGIHYSAWGSFLGQLFLRSMDRAQELYHSMQLRGFTGEFYYAETRKCTAASWFYLFGTGGLILAGRFFNISQLLGSFLVS